VTNTAGFDAGDRSQWGLEDATEREAKRVPEERSVLLQFGSLGGVVARGAPP
jgi:hypothetical protein